MKIYFAGSIRGGRVDAGLYRRMIAHIQKRHTVLTEQVGDLSIQRAPTDEAIYAQDTVWLREADAVVAECSCPSHGVGYELGYAEARGKPVHIFYHRQTARLSAMLAGNPSFHIHPYSDETELFAALDAILEHI